MLCLLACLAALKVSMSAWTEAMLWVDSPRSRRSLSYSWATASTLAGIGAFLISSSVIEISIFCCIPASISALCVLNESRCTLSMLYCCSVLMTWEWSVLHSVATSLVVSVGFAVLVAIILRCFGVGRFRPLVVLVVLAAMLSNISHLWVLCSQEGRL